jgi:O-antigen/teichoic acid export membrane protein
MMKSIFTFSVISFIRPALGFILLPLYLIYLNPSDYAKLALIGIVAGVLAVFANFKLDHGMRTFFFEYQDNPERQANYLQSVLSASFLMTIALLIIVYFSGDVLFDLFFSAGELSFYPLGLMAVASEAINQSTLSYFVYLQNTKNLRLFTILRLVDITINVVLKVVLVTVFELGIAGILIGSLVSAIVVLLVVVAKNIKSVLTLPDFTLLKPSFKFVTPLIMFSFVTMFGSASDRLVLERYLDYSDLGIYTIVLALIGASTMVFNALDNGFRPYLYDQLKNNYESQKISVFLSMYCAIGLTALFLIACVATNIHLITTNVQYDTVSQWVPYAALAFCSICITRFYALNYVFYKKSVSLTFWSSLKVVITIVMLLILVPAYGMAGAFMAVGIGNVLNVILFVVHIRSFAIIQADVLNLLQMFIVFFVLMFVIPNITSWEFNSYYSIAAGLAYLLNNYLININKAKLIIDN